MPQPVGRNALEQLDGLVNTVLRIDVDQQMHVIRHNFEFYQIKAVFAADFGDQFLKSGVHSVDQDLTAILRTPDHMILTGVDYV